MSHKVSVIIPVYNAEHFLEQCVQSVIDNQYVGEVMLVEDKSTDNSLDVCHKLASQYSRITLLRHPNGENRGAGASRNLGLETAKESFVAFLDADDWYMPERFDMAVPALIDNPEIDYVFGASQIDTDYAQGNNNFKRMILPSEDSSVFELMLTATAGYFDTNSITIRKSSLLTLSHWFNTNLRLHQDSELWLRIAYHLTGKADTVVLPGAIVRRHPGNRIIHRNNKSAQLYWNAIFEYFKDKDMNSKNKKIIQFYHKFYNSINVDKPLSFFDKCRLKANIIKFRYFD